MATGTTALLRVDKIEQIIYLRSLSAFNAANALQTKAGYAGKLTLALISTTRPGLITISDDLKENLGVGVESTGFSVSAIPVAVQMTFLSVVQGFPYYNSVDKDFDFGWGTSYNEEFKSDSGFVRDLDQVKVTESLTTLDPSNNLASEAFHRNREDGFNLVTDRNNEVDNHEILFAEQTKNDRAAALATFKSSIEALPGFATESQIFLFMDLRSTRTGTKPAIDDIAASGFTIRMGFSYGDLSDTMSVIKTAASVTRNNGVGQPYTVQPGILTNPNAQPSSFEVE